MAARAALLAVLLFSCFAIAHDGPPYPILVDEATPWGPFSIWTDPNVGTGTFMLMMDAPTTRLWNAEVSVQPPNSEKIEGPYSAVRSPEIERGSGRNVLVATIPFAFEGKWNIRFHLHDPSLSSHKDLAIDVNVTPKGPGKTEFAVYFLPFVLLGAVWLIAMLKRKRPRASIAD